MFMCWFKCSSTGAEQIIMRRFGNPVTGGMMLRIVASSSVLQWYVRGTDTVGYVANSPNTVDDNVWHCAVGTREGGTANLYLDGELVATQSVSVISHDPGTNAKFCIGAEEIDLNTTGLNAITSDNDTVMCLMNGTFDFGNTTPSSTTQLGIAFGTTMQLEYVEAATAGPANLTSLNTIAKASITSFNTITLANIDEINTVS
jgi:hypothetical protein